METDTTKYCEDILVENWTDCETRGLFKKWDVARLRLVERRIELIDVYENLFKQTQGNRTAIYLFFDSLICAYGGWNPNAIASMRNDKKILRGVNDRISELSHELASLFSKKSDIENRNGFSSDTHYSITGVIEDASFSNGHYQSWLKPRIQDLTAQFDMKYWPSLEDIFETISDSHHNASIDLHGDVTAMAMASQRHSKADFCRALFQRVEDAVDSLHSALPRTFKLTDENWASIINCILDLAPDDLIDGAYIKRQRQSSKSLK